MAKLSKALGVDLSDIARLIQSKGRRGDTMLAHITPREAAILKARGGSGSINPDTGLPEFYDGFDFGTSTAADILSQPTQFQAGDVGPVGVSAPAAMPTGGDYLTAGYTAPTFGITPEVGTTAPTFGEFAATPTTYGPTTYAGVPPTLPTAPSALAGVTPEKDILGDIGTKISDAYKKASLTDLLRLGLSGGTALYGGIKGREAAKQAEQLRSEIQAQAAPYYQRGAEYIRRGETGQLLPAQQQALDAARAQAAQARARAGVGPESTMAQQQEAQIQRQADTFRQNLIDYGFSLNGIGDSITQNAIKAGYAASQDANTLAQRMYMAAATLGLGGLPVTTQTPTPTRTA